MIRVIFILIITLWTGIYAEVGDKYLGILKAHNSFSDNDGKYFVSIYMSLNDGVVFQIIVKNDGSIDYVRNVVNFAYQNSGSTVHNEFVKIIELVLPSALPDDINTFIPQTLITYKKNGKWVTNWFSSGRILPELFMATINKKE